MIPIRPIHRLKVSGLLVLMLIAAGSCRKESVSQPSPDPYLLWQSYGFHDYTVEQTRVCFCIDGGVPMRVIVRSDTIAAVLRLPDQTPLPADQRTVYLTVEQLFAHIRTSRDSMIVRYDETYGFPEHLDIQPQLHPVDGGVLYATRFVQAP